MKILYDNQVFSWQKVGGISRYFVELIQNFSPDVEAKLPLIYSSNMYLNFKNLKSLEAIFSRDFFGKDRIISFLNKLAVKRSLAKKDFDVFHPTYFDNYFLRYLGDKPFVLTIHDMIPENFPQDFPSSSKLVSCKKELAHKASKIISISNATKQEILKHYPGIDERKIEIVYHGSNFSDVSHASPMPVPSNYILFVGQRRGYKNFFKFLAAYRSVNKQYPHIELVCTGAQFDEEEIRLIGEYGLTDKVHHSFTSDSALQYLYQNASFFIFPSKEEGFGLPLLEAMSSDCPIICSDIICFREIAGDAALYFDCECEKSIENTILSALADESLLAKAVNAGNLRILDFSWQKSADQLSNIYKTLN